jgi:Family of unknown function (DUF5691)
VTATPKAPFARSSPPTPSTPSAPSTWPEVLAAALVGTARSGARAEALLDLAATHALRRRAGLALTTGAVPPPPAPADDCPPVGPAAATRADALLALDRPAREVTPVSDMPARLELLAEWLTAAAAAGRRLPAELVPALLDAARRHRDLRPLVRPVAGPLAAWLAAQRPDWAYASTASPATAGPDEDAAWELGSIASRAGYLGRLRRHDPDRAAELLAQAWDAEPPDDRAVLLATLATGLAGTDEPLLERALDDRRRQVRAVALGLLGRLPDSGYANRMAARAGACLDLSEPGRIGVTPPPECDRSMVRDGIAQRPPAGIGERAWWLEEILARTPVRAWPAPEALLARRMSQEWLATVRRGLARAAATQRDEAWAAALVDPLTADVAARGHPADRLLLEGLYDALPPQELATRATTALARGLVDATAIGVEHVLTLCPRPWPAPVADAVFAAIADQLDRRGGAWRLATICELAALRLPAGFAPGATELLDRLRSGRSKDPAVGVVERFAATLKFRHDMLEELA